MFEFSLVCFKISLLKLDCKGINGYVGIIGFVGEGGLRFFFGKYI